MLIQVLPASCLSPIVRVRLPHYRKVERLLLHSMIDVLSPCVLPPFAHCKIREFPFHINARDVWLVDYDMSSITAGLKAFTFILVSTSLHHVMVAAC
jgi:hypothetical protein